MERENGEEFRDDLRGVDAERSITEVRKLLPPAVLAELTRLDPWRASYAIAQTLYFLQHGRFDHRERPAR